MGESNSPDKSVRKAWKRLETCERQRCKVRVIHLRNPLVIDTSVNDFKDVVQRLTGMERSSKESLKTSEVRHPTVPLKYTSYSHSKITSSDALLFGNPLAPVNDKIHYKVSSDQLFSTSDYSQLGDFTLPESNVVLRESMYDANHGFEQPHVTPSGSSAAS